ncbi:MAG: CoA transferase [Gammaproteobacteria bacterium]|nr:CoA transferase [Gammaproteobacteria bacterium]
MNNNDLPLSGIKVVEFTHMVMGPTAGLILADMGANAIKVEPLKGDNTRRLKGSGAGCFPMYNRNKRSICLDLKSIRGKEAAFRLVKDADVLIENFRPGAMERLGFAYDDLSKINTGLIYCSLKGFLSGPYEERTALDEVTQMMGGLAYMTGLPGRPLRAGSSVIDITGGMFGVIAILAALEQRHRTGKGQQVTSSLFETTAFLVGQHLAQEGVTGTAPPPMSVRTSAWSIYEVFKSADNEQVFVGVVSNSLWKLFCHEFELTEFANDKSLDTNNHRVDQRERILPVVREMFANMDKAEMIRRLEKAGIPFAPVNRPSDLIDDPHMNASGALVEVTVSSGESAGQKIKIPAIPVEMNQRKFDVRRDLPTEGRDSLEVLEELGYSPDELQLMMDEDVVR